MFVYSWHEPRYKAIKVGIGKNPQARGYEYAECYGLTFDRDSLWCTRAAADNQAARLIIEQRCGDLMKKLGLEPLRIPSLKPSVDHTRELWRLGTMKYTDAAASVKKMAEELDGYYDAAQQEAERQRRQKAQAEAAEQAKAAEAERQRAAAAEAVKRARAAEQERQRAEAEARRKRAEEMAKAEDQFDRDVREHYESRAKSKRFEGMTPQQNQGVYASPKMPGVFKLLIGLTVAGVLILAFPILGSLLAIGGMVFAAYLKGRADRS